MTGGLSGPAGDLSATDVDVLDGCRGVIGAPITLARTPTPGTCACIQERQDVDPGGSDIDGEAAGDFPATRPSMSSDGTRGRRRPNTPAGTEAGHVRVAESGGTWTQVGSDIDGEAAEDQSGCSTIMSSDTTRVAVGAPVTPNGSGPAGA